MTTDPLTHRPELLAPAGKAAGFYTALKSGADAVYCGLHKFNARLRAENFSLSDLARLVPFAHERNNKVYVTMNTLLKQTELAEAVSILAALEKLSVDAIIVADLGLIAVAGRHFPRLRLHASTQMGIHNSPGVAFAAELGIKRVILARELTFEELVLVRQRTRCELEVFIHGALCYSFSGFCLASSYIGGKSGNRGLCTQVCRREFQQGKISSPFFSPRDLETLNFIPRFSELKIDALKIEGRMKGPSYLSTVVSIYRRAIDYPEQIPVLKREIEQDFGRKKTSFFLSGRAGGIIQDQTDATGTGRALGTVLSVSNRTMTLESLIPLFPGDSLRIQPASGFEGKRYKIASVLNEKENVKIGFHLAPQCAIGDSVFLVERGSASGPEPHPPPAQKTFTARPFPKAQAIVNGFTPRHPRASGPPVLSIKIDSPAWLPLLTRCQPATIILPLEADSFEEILQRYQNMPVEQKKKIVISLPLFIAETRIKFFHDALNRLCACGLRRFFCESAGNVGIAPKEGRLEAGTGIPALNIPARILLDNHGVNDFIYSFEDDFLNIRNTRCLPGQFTLFAHIPLFVSRIDHGLADRTLLGDRNNNKFFTARRQGLYYLVGQTPLCLFHKRQKLADLGIRRFLIDLSFMPPDDLVLRELLAAFREQRRILPSTMFNFKRELA